MENQEESIPRQLGYLEHLRHHAMDKTALECGLYAGQPRILFMLDYHGGQWTQNEIAQRLRVSAPTVATSIKRMEKAGLLEKGAHPTDQRRNLIQLTPLGKEIVDHCRAQFEDMDACIMASLDARESETFKALLGKIICNLENYNKSKDEEAQA